MAKRHCGVSRPLCWAARRHNRPASLPNARSATRLLARLHPRPPDCLPARPPTGPTDRPSVRPPACQTTRPTACPASLRVYTPSGLLGRVDAAASGLVANATPLPRPASRYLRCLLACILALHASPAIVLKVWSSSSTRSRSRNAPPPTRPHLPRLSYSRVRSRGSPSPLGRPFDAVPQRGTK